MVLGIGTDIVEIARIRDAFQRHGERFLARIFLPEEIAYCQTFQDPCPQLAARFAAKEAVVKALGTGFGEEMGFHDIEIVRSPKGQPSIRFSEAAHRMVEGTRCLITMSHCREHATATAIWVSTQT